VNLTEWGKSVKVAPNEVKFASTWLWSLFSNLWRAFKIIVEIHTQQNSPLGLTVFDWCEQVNTKHRKWYQSYLLEEFPYLKYSLFSFYHYSYLTAIFSSNWVVTFFFPWLGGYSLSGVCPVRSLGHPGRRRHGKVLQHEIFIPSPKGPLEAPPLRPTKGRWQNKSNPASQPWWSSLKTPLKRIV